MVGRPEYLKAEGSNSEQPITNTDYRLPDTERRSPMKPSIHTPPCDEIIVLKEKVAALEAWRSNTEVDLKAIQDVISQVRLLMALSIGGGGLSILTLGVTFVLLVTGK